MSSSHPPQGEAAGPTLERPISRRLALLGGLGLAGATLTGCSSTEPASSTTANPAVEPAVESAPSGPDFADTDHALGLLERYLVPAPAAAGTNRSAECALPFPSRADLARGTVVAYEENKLFAYADMRLPLPADCAPAGKEVMFDRRILVLKPGTIIVDDCIPDASGGVRVGWRGSSSIEPAVTDRAAELASTSGKLTVSGLVPGSVGFERRSIPGSAQFQLELVRQSEADGRPRFTSVFALTLPHRTEPSIVRSVEQQGEVVRLEVESGRRLDKIELSSDREIPSQIAMLEKATGRAVTMRRVLPSGVLPHGHGGVEQMEAWDEVYRDKKVPPWDVGRASSQLVELVKNGTIKPCRAIELGCGSGMDAIFLASQGFDVTAVDIAPSALGYCNERAGKAGVEVRWMLADVTNMPDVGQYDLLFDRGCYHNLRRQQLEPYLKTVKDCSREGSLFLILAANANDPNVGGPPRVSESQLRSELAGLFEIVLLEETRFDQPAAGGLAPLAWVVLARRTASP